MRFFTWLRRFPATSGGVVSASVSPAARSHRLKEVDPSLVDTLEKGEALTSSVQEQLRRHVETVRHLLPETEVS